MSLELHMQLHRLFVDLSVSLDDDYSFPPSKLDFGFSLSPHPSSPFLCLPFSLLLLVCVYVCGGEIISYQKFLSCSRGFSWGPSYMMFILILLWLGFFPNTHILFVMGKKKLGKCLPNILICANWYPEQIYWDPKQVRRGRDRAGRWTK